MTVQSLINFLSACDPDEEVVFVPEDGAADTNFFVTEDRRAGVVVFVGEPDLELPDEEIE